MQEIDARINASLMKTPQVIVWGTGQLAMKLLSETALKWAQIVAFVDSNPINQGKLINGMEILPPAAISELPFPILITSLIHEDSIALQIREMGFQHPLIRIGQP